jgi:hypothetical protein
MLTTLQHLTDQARAAADQHARRFPTSPEDAAQDAWQAETLTDLARQLQRLVHTADAQIDA